MDKRAARRIHLSYNYTKTHTTYLFCAAVLLRGKVVAVTTNRVSASPKAKASASTIAYDGTCTLHAERAVLRLAGLRNVRNASLVVWRNELLPSKPCPKCQGLLEKCVKRWGLRAVFYTSPPLSETPVLPRVGMKTCKGCIRS
jgi:hypothetical protein